MRQLTLGATLLNAILAGLLAGIVVALFHFVVTEPVIDKAIALEEQRKFEEAKQTSAQSGDQAQAEEMAPVVSRELQKTGGLVIGYLWYGLTWSLFFALAYYPLQSWLARFSRWRGAFLLAGLAYWSIALIPFLRYPANPPAVGDPATIYYRQTLYLSLLGLSAAGTALAVRFGPTLARRLDVRPIWGFTLAAMILVAALLVLIMPPNPDPITAPPNLILRFRLLSLAGLTLFWAAFGLFFGWAVQRAMAARPVVTHA
jgi:predicted cobalt transporter CbtA